MAEHYLTWERLPRPDRDRQKAARAEQFRRDWQRTQPPTEPQLKYLAALGWTGEVSDRLAASELIDRLRSRGTHL